MNQIRPRAYLIVQRAGGDAAALLPEGAQVLVGAAPEQVLVLEGDGPACSVAIALVDPDRVPPLAEPVAGAARILIPVLPDDAPASAAAGYLLVQGNFTDAAKRAAYTAPLPAVYRQYGGRYAGFAAAANVRVLDGAWAGCSVILARFADFGAVSRFWNSPEYQAVKQLRIGGGTFLVMALPGR